MSQQQEEKQMQSVNLSEVDKKGKQGAIPQEASRAEALRGLTDAQGKPLGEADIAASMNGISKHDEDALAAEFIKFLGSPAVQHIVSARTGTQAQPAAQAGDAALAKTPEGKKLGHLLRSIFHMFAGKKEAHASHNEHGHANKSEDKKSDACHDKGKPEQPCQPCHPCHPCDPGGSDHASTHAAAAAGTLPKAGTNLAGLGKATTLSPSAPAAVQKFKSAIDYASQVTGIDANLIAAQIWAESRGNPGEKSTNIDGHSDVGLMQISQNTYDEYVRGGNSSLPKLNVNDPAQNILAGALELTQHLKDKGGNMSAALNAYVGEGINDKYVPNVMGFYHDLLGGRTMSDEDHV
jgi:hypothetical protein